MARLQNNITKRDEYNDSNRIDVVDEIVRSTVCCRHGSQDQQGWRNTDLKTPRLASDRNLPRWSWKSGVEASTRVIRTVHHSGLRSQVVRDLVVREPLQRGTASDPRHCGGMRAYVDREKDGN